MSKYLNADKQGKLNLVTSVNTNHVLPWFFRLLSWSFPNRYYLKWTIWAEIYWKKSVFPSLLPCSFFFFSFYWIQKFLEEMKGWLRCRWKWKPQTWQLRKTSIWKTANRVLQQPQPPLSAQLTIAPHYSAHIYNLPHTIPWSLWLILSSAACYTAKLLQCLGYNPLDFHW